MPLFFLGTREWRNRQTRTVQVRVPVMEWGFNSPLAHDETADPSGSAVFVFPDCGCGVAAPVLGYRTKRVGFVVPRVFRAPCVLSCGPGCLVCPWAVARPRAVRAASFARRVASKPGQAPPPPTGTAARPSGRSGALRTCGAGLRHGRRPARSPSAQIRPLARGRRWPRRGRLRTLRVRPLGCGSRGDLEGPRDAEVAPLAQEVIMPREGKRAEHVRQPLQLDYWSAITV